MNVLIVFLGGGLGAALRHGVNVLGLRVAAAGLGASFPYATLSINILGSLLMGMLVEYAVHRSGLSLQARLFLMTGVLGGFTTFSAFSLEAVMLYQRGYWGQALMYVGGSVILGIAALIVGIALVRWVAS